MSTYIQERFGKYAEASLVGAGRGLLSLPLEHPLDVLKTRTQANLGFESTWEIAKKVYTCDGVRGFYRGAVPNGIRLATKQMYRYPMMLTLQSFFKKTFPLDFQKNHRDAEPVATALSIASFETFIVCPLERCKVLLMTGDGKQNNLREFFRTSRGHLGRELFRGIGAVYVRQITAWASFLVADRRAKAWERKRMQTEQLSFTSLMRVSFIVGLVNTGANMPFDVVKTSLQKSEHFPDEGLWRTLKKIYRMNGITGLYAGWKPRMVQYMLQSAFTVSLLDRLEQSWKEK